MLATTHHYYSSVMSTHGGFAGLATSMRLFACPFCRCWLCCFHCRRYPRWRSFGEHKLHLCFSLALQAPFSGVWSVVRQMLRSGHLRWPCSWLQSFDCGYTHKVPSSTHKTRAYAREMHRELRQLKIMKHGPLFLPPSTPACSCGRP